MGSVKVFYGIAIDALAQFLNDFFDIVYFNRGIIHNVYVVRGLLGDVVVGLEGGEADSLGECGLDQGFFRLGGVDLHEEMDTCFFS